MRTSKSSSSATSQGGRGGGGGGTGFGRLLHHRKSHKRSDKATSATSAPNVAYFADVHSSSCRRGFGLPFGFALGVFAIGSSMTTRCGFVQSVRTSPLARAIATGSGGSSSSVLPGFFGSATTGILSRLFL